MRDTLGLEALSAAIAGASEVAAIAERLTEAQRDALLDAKPHPVLSQELWTPMKTDEFTLRALAGIEVPWLIWHAFAGSNPIAQLGLAVRAHLIETQGGGASDG